MLQLAIADALFLLTIPFKVYEDIYQSWNLPVFVCVAKEAVIHLNYNSSVLFLVVNVWLFNIFVQRNQTIKKWLKFLFVYILFKRIVQCYRSVFNYLISK